MRNQWLIAILIAPFVKGCIYPGWSSAAELLFCSVLIGFLYYFASRQRPTETTNLERAAIEEMDKIQGDIKILRGEISALKLKLGFRPER